MLEDHRQLLVNSITLKELLTPKINYNNLNKTVLEELKHEQSQRKSQRAGTVWRRAKPLEASASSTGKARGSWKEPTVGRETISP